MSSKLITTSQGIYCETTETVEVERFIALLVNYKNQQLLVDIRECKTVGDLKLLLCRYTRVKFHHINLDNITLQRTSLQDHDLLKSLSTIHFDTLNNVGFQMLVPGRSNKGLLVLDIDGTIYDYATPRHLKTTLGPRKFLHELLAEVYKYYDLVLWSATDMESIICKVKTLKICNNQNYKISFFVNSNVMIDAHIPGFDVVKAKSLKSIWEIFPQYNPTNSIICDDQGQNLFFNLKNGIPILKYRYQHREQDNELLLLTEYLVYIAQKCPDFSKFSHLSWRRKVENSRRKRNV